MEPVVDLEDHLSASEREHLVSPVERVEKGRRAAISSLGLAASSASLGRAVQAGAIGPVLDLENLLLRSERERLVSPVERVEKGRRAAISSLGLASSSGSLGRAVQAGTIGPVLDLENLLLRSESERLVSPVERVEKGRRAAIASLGLAAASSASLGRAVQAETMGPVVDLENLLVKSERERLVSLIERVERQTGYQVRVLSQPFPRERGPMTQDYWQVDSNTIVVLADTGFLSRGGLPSLLKFNLGNGIRLALPKRYWSSIRLRYGSGDYVAAIGTGQALFRAVANICACLIRRQCEDGVPLPDSEVSSA